MGSIINHNSFIIPLHFSRPVQMYKCLPQNSLDSRQVGLDLLVLVVNPPFAFPERNIIIPEVFSCIPLHSKIWHPKLWKFSIPSHLRKFGEIREPAGTPPTPPPAGERLQKTTCRWDVLILELERRLCSQCRPQFSLGYSFPT